MFLSSSSEDGAASTQTDFINTLRSWNEMQEYSDSLDDETSCDYADLPDGNDFDSPEDFLNTTDLPF